MPMTAAPPGVERLHRLTNDDITDLYRRAKVGSKVVVLPGGKDAGGKDAVGNDAETAPAPAIRRISCQRMTAIIIPR